MYPEEKKFKLNQLLEAIKELNGVSIPYNIIKHSIIPLRNWIESEIKEFELITGDD
jgi:hypothetical protein